MTDSPKKSATTSLTSLTSAPDGTAPFGTGLLRATLDYVALPDPSRRNKKLEKPWRVAFIHAASPDQRPLGLELHGDVVLGRASGSRDLPDFDLSLYDAHKHGVSRRHAMLRPTPSEIFLIDLRSTNGTTVNAVPQEIGMARALKHNDAVTLGNLHMTIKIMDRPGVSEPSGQR